MNVLSALDARKRTVGIGYGEILQPGRDLVPFIARKLKPYTRLEAHQGCVNRLRWNKNGRILASVSDDHTIAVTDVHNVEDPSEEVKRVKPNKSLQTQHDGNIFGVCFLAGSRILATGGRDTKICLTDYSERRGLACYTCHRGSVKHIINDGLSDHVFLSASEDGTIRQFDTREPHHCNSACRNILISLARPIVRNRSGITGRRHDWFDYFTSLELQEALEWIEVAYRESQWFSKSYSGPEIKAISINPVRTELITLASSDNMIRTFDRRKMTMKYGLHEGISMNFTTPELNSICVPRHLWSEEDKLFSTFVSWSPDGERLAVTYENEHVYLFDRHFQNMKTVRKDRTHCCEFKPTSKEENTSLIIHELEAHLVECRDKNCSNKVTDKLLYLLLLRDHIGDATICENLAREAFLTRADEPLLLFRRIQACISSSNYYMTRKLCLRGSRLFPSYTRHFDKIRRICHLLLDEEIRRNSQDHVETTLKSICKAVDITSPETDIEERLVAKQPVNEDEFSDCDMHPSLGANLRYGTVGWRRWPNVETCMRLEESLTREDRHIDIPAYDSDAHETSDGEEGTVEYSREIDMGNNNRVSLQMTVEANISNPVDMPHPNQYVTYETEGSRFHRLLPGLAYSRFPVHLRREHELYGMLENPHWRPYSKCRRFSGHCNFGTDIAEIGFWGNEVLLSGSADGAVYLYEIKTGRVIDILRGHQENVNCVQVNQQGTMLATSGLDHYVQIWSPQGGYNNTPEEDMEKAIKDVQSCYSHHGRYLAPFDVGELSNRLLHDVIRSLQLPGEPSNCNIQ